MSVLFCTLQGKITDSVIRKSSGDNVTGANDLKSSCVAIPEMTGIVGMGVNTDDRTLTLTM
jgi:hypothetical protein